MVSKKEYKRGFSLRLFDKLYVSLENQGLIGECFLEAKDVLTSKIESRVRLMSFPKVDKYWRQRETAAMGEVLSKH